MKFPPIHDSDRFQRQYQKSDALNAAVGRAKPLHDPIPLTAVQILILIEEFSIEIPFITQENIKDRSKADVFTKLFAIAQSSWLIISCITRAAQGLREYILVSAR